jgi:hypothetical protein
VHQIWNRPGSPQNPVHVVREPGVCLFLLVCSGVLAVLVPVVLVSGVIAGQFANAILGAMFAAGLSYCVFLVYQANNEGIVVDQTRDAVEFPGVYFSANRIAEYFSPDFIWMKLFGRASIRLSEISQIATDQVTQSHYSKSDHRWDRLATYHLIINGTFGSAKIHFSSIEKRDEVLAVLRQANRMGIPVTRP